MKKRNPKKNHPQKKVGKKLSEYHPRVRLHRELRAHQLPTLWVDQ